jgi:hypothetical protein
MAPDMILLPFQLDASPRHIKLNGGELLYWPGLALEPL